MSSFLTKDERTRVPRLDGGEDAPVMGAVTADDDKCTGCNLCVETCPGSALQLLDGHQVRMVPADVVPCIACGDCVAICQPGALTLARPHAYTGFFRPLHRSSTLQYPRRF